MRITKAFILILLLSFQLHSMERMPLEQAIKAVQHNSLAIWQDVVRYDKFWRSIPGYIVKNFPESRIDGAKIFSGCIATQGLKHLRVPGQWDVPLRPEDQGRATDTVCLCEYIDGVHNKPITLSQMQELIVLITQAARPYMDTHFGNFIFPPETDEIVLIDTEIKSFSRTGDIFAMYLSLKTLLCHPMEPAAKLVLQRKIKELR